MSKPSEPYVFIEVESYVPNRSSGLHGKVHIRPCAGQGYATTMHIECSKSLSRGFPVGTRFLIKAKLTDREGAGECLYSYHGWKFEVIP